MLGFQIFSNQIYGSQSLLQKDGFEFHYRIPSFYTSGDTSKQWIGQIAGGKREIAHTELAWL